MFILIPELIAAIIGAAIILLYHIKIYILFIRRSQFLSLTNNLKTKQKWAKKMLGGINRELIAVQTLRNGQLASTLLATGALLVGNAIAITAFNTNDTLLIVKLVALAFLFYFSFFFFAWSLRCVNHLSYALCLIPADLEVDDTEDDEDSRITPQQHKNNILKSLKWYVLNFHFGLRCFYLAVPLGLFLISGYLMLGGSVGITLALILLDYNC
eukprot:TRINITY_DN2959_c2_g1_i2.p1 TRINITY_DN2959_c2_g1~~TRINITY_DN2959_c2_g1_i2.p1  ORF type:complete len:213 (+),score=87.63 TRINITY_DN2959_c2_g1_i2:53-691(+)